MHRTICRLPVFGTRWMQTFSHSKGMVDVLEKKISKRIAVASCTMQLPEEVCRAIFDPSFSINDKGDILGTAKLAGVMAAKKTSDLIPLCHQIALSQVIVEIDQKDSTSLSIRGTAKCLGPTGVEMEALTAVSIAALTVYDMTKSAIKNNPNSSIVISNIHLEYKSTS